MSLDRNPDASLFIWVMFMISGALFAVYWVLGTQGG